MPAVTANKTAPRQIRANPLAAKGKHPPSRRNAGPLAHWTGPKCHNLFAPVYHQPRKPGKSRKDIAPRNRKAYHRRMSRFFDMDDRARLPWRFYGATRSILARA